MAYKSKQTPQIEHIHPLAIHKHIARHFCKHAHQVLHVCRHVHHTLMHSGELIIVVGIGLSGIMFANFTGSLEGLERANMTEVSTYLLKAINNPQNILKQGNMISVWKMDDSVENSFAKGYCTYGAARISPEFFPFTDSVTQQRTRGGNAVDRCENAAATGYKIGNSPSQGALVVYDAGGRFGPYGHVGKVMHYDRSLNKIIVRDMAWVSHFTMSDRREDLATANIKCYIYNSKTSIPSDTGHSSPSTTGVVAPATTGTTLPSTGTTTTPVVTPTPITPTPVVPPTKPTTPVVTPPVVTPPVVTPTKPETPVITPPVVVPPVVTPIVSAVTKEIQLQLDKLSELGLHLAALRDMTAGVRGKETMNVGDESVVTISITDKKTGEKFDGLFAEHFDFIASTDAISIDYSSIQLVNNGEIKIHVKAEHAGSASLIINFGDEKIGKASFEVK